MIPIRQRHVVCCECKEDFVTDEIRWAHDCFGDAADGCDAASGYWFNGQTRLEMPEMKWTFALCPGSDPICDDCIAGQCGL